MMVSAVARSGWRVAALLAGASGVVFLLANGVGRRDAVDPVLPPSAGMPAPAVAADAPSGGNGPAVPSDPGVGHVRIRDSATGRALAGAMQSQSLSRPQTSQVVQVDVGGGGPMLPRHVDGPELVTVAANGYRPLAVQMGAGSGDLPTTFWLQPEHPSDALEQAALRTLGCNGCAVISGYVYDQLTGQPLVGLLVSSASGASTRTDAAGRFELMLRGMQPNLSDAQARPDTTTLAFQGGGYRAQLLHVPLYNDAQDLIVDLDRRYSGVRMDAPRGRAHLQQDPARDGETSPDAGVADQDKALGLDDPAGQQAARRLFAQSPGIPVPASIKVGTGCSGRSCTGVSVYAFEDYVGRGLDNEWIASWDADALAAGAIAYRSYAAYYVAHPVNSRYDICSSTSCQVFGAGSVATTVAAAAATRGVMLTRDGQTAAFAEYSSENNAWDDRADGLSCSNPDLSCGNGYNGSPSRGWPCLSDSVGSGRGCFGHGRGMSQWGTQRWATGQGRDWKWIADHYFNNNGRAAGMRNAFLANLRQGNVQVLDNFENGVGHFSTAPTYSGSTIGIATTSTATGNCSMRRGGKCSLKVLLVDDRAAAAPWQVRLLSAVGNPAANTPLANRRAVGLWAYAAGAGLSVAVSVDDGDGTERSVARSVPANAWTWVQWSLADAAQWSPWSGGNGRIDVAAPTLDAVWLLHANTSYNLNVYLDDIQALD